MTDTVFFSNIWGSDENLPKLAGEDANGAYSNQSAAIYGQDVPGMKVRSEERRVGKECRL